MAPGRPRSTFVRHSFRPRHLARKIGGLRRRSIGHCCMIPTHHTNTLPAMRRIRRCGERVKYLISILTQATLSSFRVTGTKPRVFWHSVDLWMRAIFTVASCVTTAYFTQALLNNVASKREFDIIRLYLFLGNPLGTKRLKADLFGTGPDPRADVEQDSAITEQRNAKHVFLEQ